MSAAVLQLDAKKSNPKKIHDHLFWAVISFAAFLVLMAVPDAAMAQSIGGALPWESFTQKIACTLTGPWMKWVAVIAIALGGMMYGLGEMNGPFQRVMQITGGFSIAIGAVAAVGWLLPGGSLGSC